MIIKRIIVILMFLISFSYSSEKMTLNELVSIVSQYYSLPVVLDKKLDGEFVLFYNGFIPKI